MISLLKSKIEKLQFVNKESVQELDKLLRISKYVIRKRSNWLSPPLSVYESAIKELLIIEEKEITNQFDYSSVFDEKKDKILNVINNLLKTENEFIANKGESLDVLLYGKKRAEKIDKIDLALLMVEQNYWDFFKNRKSRLQSEPHDCLSSHYIFRSDNYGLEIAFMDNSDLPDYIKKEALKAFTTAAESP